MIVKTSMLPGRGTTELSANPIRISPGPPSLWSIDQTENANRERKPISKVARKQGSSSPPTLLEAFLRRRDTRFQWLVVKCQAELTKKASVCPWCQQRSPG